MPRRYQRDQIRAALAQTLKQLRRKANRMSQEDLALASEVDRSYVGEIERGLRSPTIETLYRLAAALGVGCADFCREFEKNLRRKAKTK